MTHNQGNGRVRVGDFEADLATGELFHGGKRLEIQNKPFRILEVLLHSGGELVGRERLMGEVWPDVHVGQRSLNTAIRKLRIALDDNASKPLMIETIGSRGYRLLATVKFPSRKAPSPAPPAPIRLAVLPFHNLGPPEDESFCVGLTDQMIAQLGRVHSNLSVIAPATLMRYKAARKAPPRAGGRNQYSEYVLSGSILRGGRGFRIIAKLIRTQDQLCVWCESYTRNKGNILRLQEEITSQIAAAIAQAVAPPTAGQHPLGGKSRDAREES